MDTQPEVEQVNIPQSKGPWSVLLDKIAFGILNWRTTLKGFLAIYNIIFATLTAEQAKAPGAHYAQWFLTSGLVAQAASAWLSSDRSGASATDVNLNIQSVTLPPSPIHSDTASSK